MPTVLRPPKSLVPALSSLLLVTATLTPPVRALDVPIDDGVYHGVHDALGIDDHFGRWDSTIRLVYDPDDAPAPYTSNAKVLALLDEAFGYWTTVSGVQFVMEGVDASAPDDRNASSPTQRDGRVRVSWGAIGGAAGRAGPIGGFFDSDLGYFPYEDGTIELNNGANVLMSDFELIGVLVHEIGHLLGFGHSDNPESVMYANPYNFLRYPTPDDIRAAQAMYGAPATAIDVDSPVPAWVYAPPPAASATATQFLFKPNSHPSSGNGAYFEVNDGTVTSITSATADDATVWFVGSIGGSSSSVDVDATFIVVDPSGYQYEEREWELACSANSSCVRFISLTDTQVMKTLPGTWKVYVVNAATNQTLASATLSVATAPTYNQPPAATITAVAGATPASATFTIAATDPEGDNILAVWHPPGLFGSSIDVRSSFASGGSANLPVNFSVTGTHTFYIDLRDDQARYGNGPGASEAGGGFQTLLRVTTTLPGPTVTVVSSTEAAGSSAPSQQVLNAVSANTATDFLRARNVSNGSEVAATTVGFKLGASSDQGATTKTTFTTGDNVIIAGSVQPQAADIGKAANIYIVVRTTLNGVDSWTYLDSSGVFVPWPTVSIGVLQHAYTVSSLQASEAFEIFSGKLVAAQHRVYIGYRLTSGNTLYYTGQAHSLTVN